MCDTTDEGDIERYLINTKRNLELFLSYNNNSKYGAEMVDTIFKLQHKLPQESAKSALAGEYGCKNIFISTTSSDNKILLKSLDSNIQK